MAARHGEEHSKDMENVTDFFINLYQNTKEDDEEGAINVCITEVKMMLFKKFLKLSRKCVDG